MLHDPSHYAPPPVAEEIKLRQKDKDILRSLASELAQIATLPVHKEKAKLWRKLNDLESERPMVWINEICWNEMNVDDELTLQCEHSWARDQERDLRRTLYQWRHLPGDMIVNDFLASPLAIHSTDFGIIEDVDVVKTDDTNDIVSRHFKIQIKDFKDLDKIKMPVITHNEKATEFFYQAMCDVYKGIMPVKKMGQTHIWFTPWDYLIRWWGIEEAMIDMIERPELVHAGVERMVDAWMTELDQFVKLNVLSLDNDNTRIGSGGYGYTKTLPGTKYNPKYVQPHNMWGCSNAQIFSEVSPDMHWEFAMKHDMRWLSRWGMTYYGCCEPLDRKVEILKKIPNLRKVSASPWCNAEKIIVGLGNKYVLSHKPSPAILAEDDWHPDRARQAIRDFLDKTDGKCHVELIMKDISTVRYKPQRLWEWEKIAMEEVEESFK
ncbi:MAG: hypothetical protein PHR77_06935 [Kiritimatiellae bacterium]|nr:hypothetical protein [Kiritimatiellia bacterium]MDD5522060.1 hypothetical protein [Kiritimatiellia bacterium]